MRTGESSMAQRIGKNHEIIPDKDPEAGNSTSDHAPATASSHRSGKMESPKATMSSKRPSSDCSETKRTFLLIVGLIIFFCCAGCLVACFTVHMIGNHVILVLKLRQWCVLGSVILCGFPLFILMMPGVVLFIRRCLVFFNMINVNYGYYIYGLEKIVGVLLWLGSVLLTWCLLLASSEVKISKHTSQILNGITKSLATFIIGAFLWLLKNLFLNMLSYSFQVRRFDWIKKSLISQHILEVFQSLDQRQRSGQGMDEKMVRTKPASVVQWIIDKLKRQRSGQGKEEMTDFDSLNNFNLNDMSAGTMHHLIDWMIRSNLSSITRELEDFFDKEDVAKLYEEGDEEQNLKEAATIRILNSVAIDENNSVDARMAIPKSINKSVVLDLFTKEARAACQKAKEAAADHVIKRINGYAQSENIERWALAKWLVNATIERKTLIQSLKDTKSAIEKLNLLILSIVLILLFIIWLLILRIFTTNILILLLSQSFALSFMFGSMAKSGLEGIIFVFVMHPFDIGDLCLIQEEEMVVEEINLSTTVFRKNSKEKIIYPNSVLTTMPIKNFYWGTADIMGSLEFTIDGNTRVEQRRELYNRIKRYMEGKNKTWFPVGTMSAVKEIEEQKMKMVLYYTCRNINVQRSGPAMVWLRNLLMDKLKEICKDLNIKCYDIRPQAVDLSYSGFLAPARKD